MLALLVSGTTVSARLFVPAAVSPNHGIGLDPHGRDGRPGIHALVGPPPAPLGALRSAGAVSAPALYLPDAEDFPAPPGAPAAGVGAAALLFAGAAAVAAFALSGKEPSEEPVIESDVVVPITIPEAQVVDGKPFPLTLAPTTPGATTADRLAYVRAERDSILSLVEDYGALLLRGWGPCTPQDFSDIAAELASPGDFNMACSAGPRTEVAPNIFTANEAPPTEKIPFHHEMAQCDHPPSHIMFFCDVSAAAGGATPILVSHLAVDFLRKEYPAVLDKLIKHGIRYERILPVTTDPSSALGKSWRDSLEVETKEEAEEKLREEGMTWKWLPGDFLETLTNVVPAVITDPHTGQPSMFTAAETTFNKATDDLDQKYEGTIRPMKGFIFGDGTEPDEAERAALRHVAEWMEQAAVAFKWEAGDALILNNKTVQHARQKFTPPRRILAALTGRLNIDLEVSAFVGEVNKKREMGAAAEDVDLYSTSKKRSVM
jgi:alpha-ketoglutarate-dependent taurine dioxygenase